MEEIKNVEGTMEASENANGSKDGNSESSSRPSKGFMVKAIIGAGVIITGIIGLVVSKSNKEKKDSASIDETDDEVDEIYDEDLDEDTTIDVEPEEIKEASK